MKKVVVLTGAGISAESGLRTFRDADGLWENHRVENVATPEAWQRDPGLVLRFYNERRKDAADAQPNAAHLALTKLEHYFDVQIITQNVDNLHERAGSSNVLHLHGELSKVRSVSDESLIIDVGDAAIEIGDLATDGQQLRPHIVWFGEMVPMIEPAIELSMKADVFVVIGTSMQVYPAASLIQYVPLNSPKYIIDPKKIDGIENNYGDLRFIQQTATQGVPELIKQLLKNS
ncbi:MAG: NAD-dependent deacetylase [Spirosomataceae bacterium]|jgi:NAD-dependent deacetylase